MIASGSKKLLGAYIGKSKVVKVVQFGKQVWAAEDPHIDENVVAILNVTGSTETALTAIFAFTQSQANGVTVDFGDGSIHETYPDTSVIVSHTYPAAGEYQLSMIPSNGVTWEPGAYGTSGSTTDDQPFCSKSWVTRFIFREGVGFTRPRAFSAQRNLVAVDNFPNVMEIPERAFQYCSKLTGFAIPDTVTTIGEYAFYGCSSLPIAEFPSNLTTIGSYAFYDCDSLTIGYFPERLTIGDHAFYGCDGMPARIEVASRSVGGYAFGSCKSLTRVWLRNTVTTLTAYTNTTGTSSTYGTFSYCSERLVIYAEPSSRPGGWTEYFDLFRYYPKYNDRFRVIWGVSAMPDITLRIKWNENTRQLEHVETVADGPDYSYDSTTESLEYM